MRVLVVEDEIRIREGIEKLLSKFEDVECVGEALDGMEGLTKLRELRPDVVITDIMMPNMDGLEMLEMMVNERIKTKAIVLSAYSEFEYARRAMKLGVDEYLLKPISYNDFAKAIENTRVQLAKEMSEKPEEIGTLSQTFSAILNDSQNLGDEVKAYLRNNYEIDEDERFALMYLYLGEHYSNDSSHIRGKITHILSLYNGISYQLIEDEYRSSVVIIAYHFDSTFDLERFIQAQLLHDDSKDIVLGFTIAEGLEKLRGAYKELIPYMDWGISLGNGVMISYPKVNTIQTVSCIYPIDEEAMAKQAVCDDDMELLKRSIKRFMSTFSDGNVYSPREIKECLVRFLWAIIGMAKEMGFFDKKELEQQKLLNLVMDAKTKTELSFACDFLVEAMESRKEDDEVTHLTVKRMRSMIHEFYTTGITLDEIAERMHLTPEYVGTLFRKEVGVTFSVYIKNLRITKAKELLCGSDLKLYEIAEAVGYSDPKYFGKVFKEATGILPNEYRKTHK